MKKKFVFISIAAMFLGACSGNQNKEHNHSDEAHTHEDGSLHQNHDDTVIQEEFTVTADTIQNQIDSIPHSHSEHEHPHQH